MSDLQHINQLFTDLGPILEPDNILKHGEYRWQVSLPDLVILLEYNPQTSLLTQFAELPQPNQNDLVNIYENMLVFNAQFAQSKGLRLALTHPNGNALLIQDLATSNLDVSTLSASLLSLLDNHITWAKALESDTVAGTQQDEHPAHHLPIDAFRV